MIRNVFNFKDDKTTYYQPLGDPIEVLKDFAYNDKHELIVIEVGKRNIQEEIDSYKDTCGLDALINNIRLTGNVALLNQRPVMYADISSIQDTDDLNPNRDMAVASSREAELAKILGLESLLKNGQLDIDGIRLAMELYEKKNSPSSESEVNNG